MLTVGRLTFQRANVKNIGAYRKGEKGSEGKGETTRGQKQKNGNEKKKGTMAKIFPNCKLEKLGETNVRYA